MNRMMLRGIVTGVLAVGMVMLPGCGVSEERLADAEKRMNELHAKGVPDSVLSKVKVYLFEARDAANRNEGQRARRAADSLMVALENVENYYAEYVTKLPPVIDSLVDEANKAREELSGLQLRKLDSLEANVDSLMENNVPVEAEQLARELVAYVDTLKADQAKAEKLQRVVPGTWVCTNRKKSKVFKEINAVEKKVFKFMPNGKATFVETEKGQSERGLKKDYEFISYGTYDFAGDTIMVFVDRFVAKRQTFHVMHKDEKGRKSWKKQVGPTYDSLITDGSQDRFILLDDLKEDFRKM